MIRAAAPASTANLGPGFDSAGAALDLWNEVEVVEGDFAVEVAGEGASEVPRDASHLALRAFAHFAPVEGYRFSFTNRIPLERGLGSSAAAIALGLVAGAAAAGRTIDPAELLRAGARYEGHFDNLAAALYGGVCVAWSDGDGPHARRIASGMPLQPILVVPEGRTNTAHSRTGLPFTVSHEDAAVSVGAATMLGAAIATGDADLLRAAFRDRLHEQYRSAQSPLLDLLRSDHAVTLSGSGPSVVVWAASANGLVGELERIVPDNTKVLPLRVAEEGANAA